MLGFKKYLTTKIRTQEIKMPFVNHRIFLTFDPASFTVGFFIGYGWLSVNPLPTIVITYDTMPDILGRDLY